MGWSGELFMRSRQADLEFVMKYTDTKIVLEWAR